MKTENLTEVQKQVTSYLLHEIDGVYDLKDVSPEYAHMPDRLRIKRLTTDNVEFFLKYCKPVLRPISDLIKPIDHNNETFIPHNRLQLGFLHNMPYKHRDIGVAENRIQTNTMSFVDYSKCLSYKIDVYGLISSGNAYNMNDLPLEIFDLFLKQ